MTVNQHEHDSSNSGSSGLPLHTAYVSTDKTVPDFVTVTHPEHPLNGKRCEVVWRYQRAGRQRFHIVVPDSGEHHQIDSDFTDHKDTDFSTRSEPIPPLSLPIMRTLRAYVNCLQQFEEKGMSERQPNF